MKLGETIEKLTNSDSAKENEKEVLFDRVRNVGAGVVLGAS